MDVPHESAVDRAALDLSSDLTAYSPEIGQLAEWDQHLSLIAREAADLQWELSRLREESEAMARLLEQREAELADKDACVSQLTTDSARAKDEMSKVRASLADAHARLEQSSKREQSLERLLEKGEDEREQKAVLLSELTADRDHAEKNMSAAYASLSEAQALLEQDRERIASLERLLQPHRAEHAESESALSRLRVELARAQWEAAQAETSRLDAEGSLEASREQVTALEHELRLLRSRVVELEELETRSAEKLRQPSCHLRLVARPTGYALSESAEPPPTVGELIEIDGKQYAVVRIGRSPLPGDERTCVLLLVEPTRTVPPQSLDAVEPPADALVSL